MNFTEKVFLAQIADDLRNDNLNLEIYLNQVCDRIELVEPTHSCIAAGTRKKGKIDPGCREPKKKTSFSCRQAFALWRSNRCQGHFSH